VTVMVTRRTHHRDPRNLVPLGPEMPASEANPVPASVTGTEDSDALDGSIDPEVDAGSTLKQVEQLAAPPSALVIFTV
jgi:hypothetical protein